VLLILSSVSPEIWFGKKLIESSVIRSSLPDAHRTRISSMAITAAVKARSDLIMSGCASTTKLTTL
jgi:hypothetical protein